MTHRPFRRLKLHQQLQGETDVSNTLYHHLQGHLSLRGRRAATALAVARSGAKVHGHDAAAGDVLCVLIRLAPRPTRCSGSRLFGVELGVGECGNIASDAEQGAEGVKGIEAAVEAKRELVEVRLKMLRTDTVVNAT